MQRVVVTGLGCISALGNTVKDFWENLSNGRSGIGEVASLPADELNFKIAAEVKNFSPESYIAAKRLIQFDRFSQFAVAASKDALDDSGVELGDGTSEKMAVVVGTGIGGLSTIEDVTKRLYQMGQTRAHPMSVPRAMFSAAASQVTMVLGISGPCFAVSSACSSANHAIGEAFWMVRTGRAPVALCGGSEAPITYGCWRAWEALRVMSTDTCRPFCAERRGMVLGEGAGMAVIESLEHAKARGARIYCELVGFGMSSDAGDIVQPSAEGAARAITQAISEGGLNPDEVDYVNAHGTGTLINDVTETRAIHIAFKDAAQKLAVSSSKSMHGHALGGAGGIEFVATAKAIEQGVIPPTANFTKPDPECDLDYVPNEARQQPIRAAISNSFAFGGLNAVVAVKAF